MKILLDTHVFLWYISSDQRLSENQRACIQDLNNEVYLSIVSVWEVIIKCQIGKLHLPQPAATYLPAQREKHQILSLALDEKSVAHLAQLPPVHRDPFDRMIICQASVYDLLLMTDDEMIAKYPMRVLK